jgi:hypothetical protein
VQLVRSRSRIVRIDHRLFTPDYRGRRS